MDILEFLEPLVEKYGRSKSKAASLFRNMDLYLRSLTYSDPIEELFYLTGQLLESLVSKEPAAKKEIAPIVKNLKALMAGERVEVLPKEAETIKEEKGAAESSGFSYSFTEKDEAALDYSDLVTDAAMVNTFTAEVAEFLDSAQSALLDLEHDRDDSEAINSVFRCFHTIKSSSALLGYKNIEALSHHMENMLGKVRDSELLINSELIDIIFHGMGMIRDLMGVIEAAGNDRDTIIKGFKPFQLTPYINLVERITKQFRNKKIGEILVDMGALTQESLKNILRKQEADNLVFGEIAQRESGVTNDDIHKALKAQATEKNKQNFVRVSSDRLNTLVNMVGELVVNQSMIKQKILDNRSSLNEQDVNQLEEITTTIKDMVLSMGMVPLNDIFQKLRVVVRNTARDLNKVISFEVQGEDTEMDRSLVEAIYDPLVHMVRNAISHGIEQPEEREKQGKSVTGCVSISAEYRGHGVEITIRDDGKGIDPGKILDKAVSLGWITPEEKEMRLEDRAFVYSLLFRPGFSTKDKADSISGRGVGMDVVMQNITRINGKVEIHSTPGKGSVFHIKLPLTLAIIDGFVIEVMDEKYVFPFEMIEEILVNSELSVVPMEGECPVGLSRGKYLPIIDIHRLLTGRDGVYGENFVYVQIKYEEKEFAVPVNRVLGKWEIVIKSLNELIKHQKLFFGGTIFGDGSIGFILDIEEVTRQFGDSEQSRDSTQHKYSEDRNEKKRS
ncbi:MAG: chemotaxis protein CheA [Spirochaetales bacterium]|nr:chemotaxis protein CheA [Spirochaetales bacterium]